MDVVELPIFLSTHKLDLGHFDLLQDLRQIFHPGEQLRHLHRTQGIQKLLVFRPWTFPVIGLSDTTSVASLGKPFTRRRRTSWKYPGNFLEMLSAYRCRTADFYPITARLNLWVYRLSLWK